MKNLSSIVLLVFLVFTVNSYCQEQQEWPIEVLLERLNENHMGSVTDVFSIDELQRIKDYYSQTSILFKEKEAILNRRYTGTQAVTVVQAVDILPENLNLLEILANSPVAEFEGAGAVIINPPSRAFIVDNSNQVWIRGLGSGPVNYTSVGLLNGVPINHSVTGVEILSGREDQLYGITTNGSTDSRLIRINPNTLQSEVIGGNNGLILPIALAHDGNNNLFTIDIDDDKVYQIDTETGAATSIGPLGYDANFGQAMFYDVAEGLVLNMAYNAVIADSELRSINTMTGHSTSLGVIYPGVTSQFGWGSAYDRDLLGTVDSELAGLKFYPNPTGDQLNVSATSNIESIQIYNLLGQQVLIKAVNSHSDILDVSKLLSGIYILRVNINNSTSLSKFIKE